MISPDRGKQATKYSPILKSHFDYRPFQKICFNLWLVASENYFKDHKRRMHVLKKTVYE